MKKITKILLLALGFSLLTVALGFLTSSPAPAAPGPTSVTVVNTPLPVQGAVNANITNATVPISGSVAVSSLPPVLGTVNANITNSSIPVTFSGTPNVHVFNDNGAPLFVDPNASAARNAIQQNCGAAGFDGSGAGGCTMYTVGAGVNLVVDSASESLQGIATGTGEYIQHLEIGAPPSSTSTLVVPLIYLAPTQVGTNGPLTWYTANTNARLYFPTGSTVACSAQVFGGSSGALFCTFTGHLVPTS